MALKTATGPYLIQEALDYLERKGVPARAIRSLNVCTEVGQPIRLELVLLVEHESDGLELDLFVEHESEGNDE